MMTDTCSLARDEKRYSLVATFDLTTKDAGLSASLLERSSFRKLVSHRSQGPVGLYGHQRKQAYMPKSEDEG